MQSKEKTPWVYAIGLKGHHLHRISPSKMIGRPTKIELLCHRLSRCNRLLDHAIKVRRLATAQEKNSARFRLVARRRISSILFRQNLCLPRKHAAFYSLLGSPLRTLLSDPGQQCFDGGTRSRDGPVQLRTVGKQFGGRCPTRFWLNNRPKMIMLVTLGGTLPATTGRRFTVRPKSIRTNNHSAFIEKELLQ